MSELQDTTDNPRVKLELGFTRSFDYNSIRMAFGVEIDSRPNEEWTETIDREYDVLERKMLEKKADLEDELDN